MGFDKDVIFNFLFIMALIFVIKALASGASTFFLGRHKGKIEYGFKKNFARHFLYLPFSQFEKKNSGEALSIFANDLPPAINFVTDGSLRMISDIITQKSDKVYTNQLGA
ncbi:MAG: hypothetical protein LBL96_07295 [Clostridiales bacterium]|nr:hypothetical protein [Clostridiales bacterium]